jgi:23S rRNA pseudouridine2605 synthase
MKNRRPARESRDSSQRPALPASDAQPSTDRSSFESFDDDEGDGDDADSFDADDDVTDEGADEGTRDATDEGDLADAGTYRPYRGANSGGFEAPDDDEFDDEPGSRLVRLNKYLASHGVASRRGCDVLITEGGVMVDDEIVTDLGVKIDPTVQRIEVDGVVLKADGVRLRYYLLNKPSGVVCTNSERELRPRAVDLITDRDKGRLFTVGRLDEETTGLIILTNDGDFANRVMHPRYGVNKTYQVKVQGFVDDEAVQRIRDGVYLSEGITAGARVIVVRRAVSHTKLLVTIQEGKNREVRRVFARFGYKVSDLKRIKIGPLTDRGIKPGSWRPLKRSEIEALLSGPSEEDVQQERRAKKRHGRTGGVRRFHANSGDRRGGRDRRGSGDPRGAGEQRGASLQRGAQAPAAEAQGRGSRDRRGLDARGADAPRSRSFGARGASDQRSTRDERSEPRVQRRVIGGDEPRGHKREGNRIVGREAYKRVDGMPEPRTIGRDEDRRPAGGRGRDERSQGSPRFGRNRTTGERRDERASSGNSAGGSRGGTGSRGRSGGDSRGGSRGDERSATRSFAARRGDERSERSDRGGRSGGGERREGGGRSGGSNSRDSRDTRDTRDTRTSGGECTSRTGKRRGPETFVSPTGRRVIS